MNIGDKFLVVKSFKGFAQNISEVINKEGTIIEFVRIEDVLFFGKIRTKNIFKNLTSGKEMIQINPKKVIDYKDGDIIPDFEAKIIYKIKYEGKFLKPKKFKDIGQIKTSLLICFGYYDKLRTNANYINNPELSLIDIPYWFEGKEIISLEQFKNIQIISIQNKIEISVDFNAYEYIKESNIKLNAICNYGSVVKDIFSKIKDNPEYNYFISITPEKYKELSKSKWNYKIARDVVDLKEDPKILECIKRLGLKSKDYKKISKMGKTAIAVKDEQHLLSLMNLLNGQNINVFTLTKNNVIEYDKEARRKQIINSFI